MDSIALIPPIAAVVASGAAAVTDARTGHIPNAITLPAIVGAIAFHGVVYGVEGAKFSALGMLACGLPPYLMFRMGGMGGGDVKLFAALGALLGLQLGLEVELAAMCVGSIWAMAKVVRARRLGPMLRNSVAVMANAFLPAKLERPIDPAGSDTLRLGVSVFLGTVGVIGLHLLGGRT